MRDRAERLQVRIVNTLKDLRKQNNLSHDALAHRAGVTRSAISHIENGRRNPSLLMCLRLAQGLNTDLSEVVRVIEARCQGVNDCSQCQYLSCCP